MRASRRGAARRRGCRLRRRGGCALRYHVNDRVAQNNTIGHRESDFACSPLAVDKGAVGAVEVQQNQALADAGNLAMAAREFWIGQRQVHVAVAAHDDGLAGGQGQELAFIRPILKNQSRHGLAPRAPSASTLKPPYITPLPSGCLLKSHTCIKFPPISEDSSPFLGRIYRKATRRWLLRLPLKTG